MYYVKQVDEDAVTIENNREERVVNIEDLRSIEDVIIGFNKITGKLKVCDDEDIRKYIHSRIKLAGSKDEDFRKVDRLSKLEKISDTEVKVRVSLEYSPYYDILRHFVISYDTLMSYVEFFCEEYDMITPETDKSIEVYFEFDLYIPHGNVKLTFEPTSSHFRILKSNYGKRDGAFLISGITFTDRTNFSGFSAITGIFTCIQPETFFDNEEDIAYKTMLSKSLCVDMSNLTVKRDFNICTWFGGYVVNIIPPKFVGESVPMFLSSPSVIIKDVDELANLDSFAKEYNSEEKLEVTCYIESKTNVAELFKYEHLSVAYRVKDLYLGSLDTVSERSLSNVDTIFLDNYTEFEDESSTNIFKFGEDFFDFVRQLEDHEREDIRNFILGYLQDSDTFGYYNTEQISDGKAKLIFLTRYREVLERVNGYKKCKLLSLLQMVCSSNYVRLVHESIDGYSKKDLYFICLLIAIMTDVDNYDDTGKADFSYYVGNMLNKDLTYSEVTKWED